MIWRLSDGFLLHELDGGGSVGGVPALAFAPGGTEFATGSFGYAGFFPSFGEIPVRLLLWRVSDGQLLTTFTNFTTATTNLYTGINALAFSSDGKILVLRSSDYTIRFWRVSDGALLRLYDQPAEGEPNGAISALAVSPDGRLFAYRRVGGPLVVANAPLLITESTHTNGQTILRWQGGRGVDQVQQRTNLAVGSWENVGGATTNLSATNALPGTNVFCRIRSSYR